MVVSRVARWILYLTVISRFGTVRGCYPSTSWLPVIQSVFNLRNSIIHLSFCHGKTIGIVDKSHGKSIFTWTKAQIKAGLYLESLRKIKINSRSSPSRSSHVFCSCTEQDLASVLKLIDNNNLGTNYPAIIFHSVEETANMTSIDSVRIDQQVYFINTKSGDLTEAYSIMGNVIINRLGLFNVENMTFGPLKAWKNGFLRRRSNFHGYHIPAMTDNDTGRMNLRKDYKTTSPYHESNQTYDVTDATNGPYKTHFQKLAQELNFTFSLYRRKSGGWTGQLKNGTFTGMFHNLLDEQSADMIMTSLTMNPWRFQHVDYLPILVSDRYGVFIRNKDIDLIQWTTFIRPFSIILWLTLIVVAAVIATWLYHSNFKRPAGNLLKRLVLWLGWLWTTLTANVGRKLSNPLPKKTNSNQVVIFTCLLVGNIIWIGYRASFTSELSVKHKYLPFNSLEGLLKSDFK